MCLRVCVYVVCVYVSACVCVCCVCVCCVCVCCACVVCVCKSIAEKTGWLYVNINPETSTDRARALAILAGKSFVTLGQNANFETYLQHLSAHRFVSVHP